MSAAAEPSVATDLHGHTYASDGAQTVEQLVARRAEHGRAVFAVSEHDHFACSLAAARLAQAHGLTAVPAAEVTSVLHFGTERAEQIHILAYFPPSWVADGRLARTALFRRGQEVQARWRDFVVGWLDSLPAEDREVIGHGGRLAALPPAAFPALQTTLELVNATCPDQFDAFRRHHVRFWLDDAALFAWTPEEVIDAIRGDGGKDVVAHPVRYKDKDRLEQILDYAWGIEAYTSRHNPRVAERFRARAEARGQRWTASTDDHGHTEYVPPPEGTPLSTVQAILQGPVPGHE